ncbi:MAG: MraY family glycosyltransferase [Planctomycetota bacterium]
MPNDIYTSYALALGSGLVAGLVATPIVRWLARRWNFVDKPDGDRKHQSSAVALGGGIAVYVAMLSAIAVTFAYARGQDIDLLNFNANTADRPIFLALLVASTLTVLLGLFDDKFGLRGRYKLLCQVAIAGILVYSGLSIDHFGFMGAKVVLPGWLSAPVTLVWLLVTINAINLIDGIDGLASSIGAVLCLTVAAITAMLGYHAEAFIVLALAGAQLGFLRYNFAPASIYLGDTGSMLIGLVVGVIATHTSVKSPAAIAMAVPFALWSIPILDSSAAILRRKLTGRSLFAPDRGHLHHSLLTRGWTVRQASMFITLICATTCLSAVLSLMWGSELIALLIVAAVVLFLVSTRTFGHIELELLKHRVRDSTSSFSSPAGDASQGQHSAVQLQGSRQWDKLWAALVEAAPLHRLVQMKLAINIPVLHEAYFAKWKTPNSAAGSTDLTWSIVHPLVLDGQKVGHLELLGNSDIERASTPAQLIQVLDFLEPIEEDIRRIREQLEHDHEALSGKSVLTPAFSSAAGESVDAVSAPAGGVTG